MEHTFDRTEIWIWMWECKLAADHHMVWSRSRHLVGICLRNCIVFYLLRPFTFFVSFNPAAWNRLLSLHSLTYEIDLFLSSQSVFLALWNCRCDAIHLLIVYTHSDCVSIWEICLFFGFIENKSTKPFGCCQPEESGRYYRARLICLKTIQSLYDRTHKIAGYLFSPFSLYIFYFFVLFFTSNSLNHFAIFIFFFLFLLLSIFRFQIEKQPPFRTNWKRALNYQFNWPETNEHQILCVISRLANKEKLNVYGPL